MANIKVILTDQSGNDYDVSYIQEIPLSLNFLIADVKNPDKRNSTYSKTINFPGTKDIDIFFSLIWRINNDLSAFDPRLKCQIKYYVNERIQLSGDLQLIKINVDPDSNEKIYECSATGTLGNLFISIGDRYLTDLDFSAYDHALTKVNVKNSWIPATSVTGVLGSGYYYGLINYGQNQVNSEAEYHVKHMRPQFYKREVWAKIFSPIGKTWTSNFLDSTYYKSKVIPTSAEYVKLSTTANANSQFLARRNANQTGTANAATFGTAWNIGSAAAKDVCLFNEDNVLPYNDAGGQYGTGTGEFVVAVSNNYTLSTTVKFNLLIANTVGTATNVNVSVGSAQVYLQKWNGATWILISINGYNFGGAYSSLTLTGEINITLNNALVAGDKYRIVIFPFNMTFTLFTAGMVAVTTGTTTVTPIIKTNSLYSASLVNNEIVEGATLEMNQCLPIEVKQIDWIMTEIREANLYMVQDPNDENNYIIEPRDAGFFTGQDNWSKLLDYKKKVEVLPMSELDSKRYEWTYKTDADEFNTSYVKSYQQVYGFGFTDCISDFVRPTKKTELIYAATPLAGNSINGLVLPKIYRNDNGAIKPFKSVIRSLYNGGLINLSFGNWTLKSAAGDETLSQYPFVGDCDNPYAPTLTLNWDTPKAVYYSYVLATYTDNNLKNKYYSRMINQLSDKRSCVVKAWFNLDELTIKEFSFRKVIWVEYFNAFFYVNSIDSYNVMDRESTLVTLLKLENYDQFVPSNVDTPDEVGMEAGRIINGNYSNGINNTNNGTASHIVGGSGNYIAPGAQNIQLRNCTNIIVQGDVIDFIGDGLSDVVIDSSCNSSLHTSVDSSVEVLADLTLNTSYNKKILRINCTAGDVTLIWDSATMTDCKVYIVRMDGSANKIFIRDSDATTTYLGAAVPADLGMVQYGERSISSIIPGGSTPLIYLFS